MTKRSLLFPVLSGFLLFTPLSGMAGGEEASERGGEPHRDEEVTAAPRQRGRPRPLTIFLSGDVMTGRGIDQVLPHPSDPRLHEPYMKSADGYVKLAEKAHGPIGKPVSCSFIWGDALAELQGAAPDVRIINLETTITESDDFRKEKQIHYRMHPANIDCLKGAAIDFASLANNHILDWGYSGLADTIETLDRGNIRHAGAGRNLTEAGAPAILTSGGNGRVIVFSYGSVTSGIPRSWAALEDRAGVNLLEDYSDETVRQIGETVGRVKQRGDIVVVSLHWGGNWGYVISDEQRAFAHRLIDRAGVDVIHGHSSHHVKGIEVYRGRLILYGCGDFLNDYEGIGGHEHFRGDLALIYLLDLDPSTGKLLGLQMIPMEIRRFRLNRASRKDSLWLRDLLNREGERLGTRVALNEDNSLTLKGD